MKTLACGLGTTVLTFSTARAEQGAVQRKVHIGQPIFNNRMVERKKQTKALSGK